MQSGGTDINNHDPDAGDNNDAADSIYHYHDGASFACHDYNCRQYALSRYKHRNDQESDSGTVPDNEHQAGPGGINRIVVANYIDPEFYELPASHRQQHDNDD